MYVRIKIYNVFCRKTLNYDYGRNNHCACGHKLGNRLLAVVSQGDFRACSVWKMSLASCSKYVLLYCILCELSLVYIRHLFCPLSNGDMSHYFTSIYLYPARVGVAMISAVGCTYQHSFIVRYGVLKE